MTRGASSPSLRCCTLEVCALRAAAAVQKLINSFAKKITHLIKIGPNRFVINKNI